MNIHEGKGKAYLNTCNIFFPLGPSLSTNDSSDSSLFIPEKLADAELF